MTPLTELDFVILAHLAKYTYLSHRQLLDLTETKSLKYVERRTRTLSQTPTERKPCVGVMKYPVSPRFGKIQYIYYLTQWGLQTLTEHDPEFDASQCHIVKRPNPFYRDYHHRFQTISSHITISKMLERQFPHLEIDFWHAYFQKTGSQRSPGKPLHAKTRIAFDEDHFMIPDVIFHLRKQESEKMGLLVALEVSRGQDLKRILRQMMKHAHGLRMGAIGKKYGLPIGHKVLFVFERESLLQSVMVAIPETPSLLALADYFFLTSFTELLADANACWHIAGKGGHFSFVTGKASIPA